MNLLEDYVAEQWTLKRIHREFENVGVEFNKPADWDNVMQTKRDLFRIYTRGLDMAKPEDADRVAQVFEIAIDHAATSASDSSHGQPARDNYDKWTHRLINAIQNDSYSFDGEHLSRDGSLPHLSVLRNAAEKHDAPYIHKQIDRIMRDVESDPDGAIGTAKELLETTCKSILTERGIAYEKKCELPKLVHMTRKELNLIPENFPSDHEAANTIIRLISGLGNAVQSLAELRNEYGTGHGPEGKVELRLQPRHARLAAGAAHVLAVFLLDTHEARHGKQEV